MHRCSSRDRAEIEAGTDASARGKTHSSPVRRRMESAGRTIISGVDGTFIHPFDDDNFIAGHGTMGLEILEDAPDTAAVIASIGGGGLITGVASAIKALSRKIKIFGVEPETAAPSALSFEKGSPQVFQTGKRHLWMAPAVKACSLACGNE